MEASAHHLPSEPAGGLLRATLETGLLQVALRGSSLSPLAAAGEFLFVERVSAAEVRAGEIVVFRSSDALTAHRVLYKRERGGLWFLRTVGQTALSPDPWVAEAALVGRVVAIGDGERRRAAPAGLASRLWAVRRRARCLVHCVYGSIIG